MKYVNQIYKFTFVLLGNVRYCSVMEDKFYTVEEVAKALKVHKRTVLSLIKRKKLLAVNVGCEKRASWRIYDAQFIRFIADSYPD